MTSTTTAANGSAREGTTRNLVSISPFFIVKDLQASIAFYIERLGFKVDCQGPDGDVYCAGVSRDGIGIMLKTILPARCARCFTLRMKPLAIAVFTLILVANLAVAQQAPPPSVPPNQVALAEAREHAKAGRTQEAIAALERVTPPAPGVLNQLRTSDDFKVLRDDARFQAIVAKLTPCSGPQHKEFDFWIGDWEVRNAAGQVVGRNRITKKHAGCVVLEEWESAAGGSGSSFNFYDQPTRQWHQFWVDASGTNWLSSDKQGNPVTLRGGIRDGAMVLSSHPDTLPSIGLTRATWRPQPDGGVRQTFESSRDGGKTWTVSFDGFYKKSPVR